jgi:hypothetical protein
MLRNLPVLLEGYRLMVAEEPMIKTREENGRDVPVTDRDGATLFTVSVFVKPPADEKGRSGKGLEVKVTLETEPGEEIEYASPVELINPRISQWEMDGRAGVAWKATGVKLVRPQRAASAA